MRIFLVNPGLDEFKKLELPSGVENLKKTLMDKYPKNAKEIKKFLDAQKPVIIYFSNISNLFFTGYEPKALTLLKYFKPDFII